MADACYLIIKSNAFWPLHDVAITNIVWCKAYQGGLGSRVNPNPVAAGSAQREMADACYLIIKCKMQ